MALSATDLFLVQSNSTGVSYSINGGELANELTPLATVNTFTSDVSITGNLSLSGNILGNNLLPTGNFLLNPDNDGNITLKADGVSGITFECANSPITFKSGTNANSLRLYEPSGNGSFYLDVAVSNLTANRTFTFPDQDGVIATVGDISTEAASLQAQITANDNNIADLLARVNALEA